MINPRITAPLAALRAEVDGLPADALPDFIGELASLQARAWQRLTMPAVQQPAAAAPQYLDANQIAQRLNVAEHWVRDRARRGEIPHEKLGHYMRFEWHKVKAAIEAMNGNGAQDDAS